MKMLSRKSVLIAVFLQLCFSAHVVKAEVRIQDLHILYTTHFYTFTSVWVISAAYSYAIYLYIYKFFFFFFLHSINLGTCWNFLTKSQAYRFIVTMLYMLVVSMWRERRKIRIFLR